MLRLLQERKRSQLPPVEEEAAPPGGVMAEMVMKFFGRMAGHYGTAPERWGEQFMALVNPDIYSPQYGLWREAPTFMTSVKTIV